MTSTEDIVSIMDSIVDPKNRSLLECMADDMNSHIRAINRLGKRTVMTPDDVHNLFVRWSLTARAAMPPYPDQSAEKRPNMMDTFKRGIEEQEAARGKRLHPALSDPGE